MTFKHTKFEESATMRSLERLVLSNGEASIEKTAENIDKKDMNPSQNMFENLTKLCSGLREKGLGRYADELENNYLIYKSANVAYETSKETGESLINDAHPGGSVKISDSEYAVIETIVDQQMKTLKMIDKMPTGKLADSAAVLNAVKVSLGQTIPSIIPQLPNDIDNITSDQLVKWRQYYSGILALKIKKNIDDANYIIDDMFNSSFIFRLSFEKNYNEIKSYLLEIENTKATWGNLNGISIDLVDILESAELVTWKDFGFLTPAFSVSFMHRIGDIADAVRGNYLISERNKIIQYINFARAKIDDAKNLYLGKNDKLVIDFIKLHQQQGVKEKKIVRSSNEAELRNAIRGAYNKLRMFGISVTTNSSLDLEERKNTINWINDKSTKVNFILETLIKLEPNQKNSSIPLLYTNLKKITANFDEFEKTWIN